MSKARHLGNLLDTGGDVVSGSGVVIIRYKFQ